MSVQQQKVENTPFGRVPLLLLQCLQTTVECLSGFLGYSKGSVINYGGVPSCAHFKNTFDQFSVCKENHVSHLKLRLNFFSTTVWPLKVLVFYRWSISSGGVQKRHLLTTQEGVTGEPSLYRKSPNKGVSVDCSVFWWKETTWSLSNVMSYGIFPPSPPPHPS